MNVFLKLILRTIITSCFIGLCVFKSFAYDGDVDYSAPYVTVDPETGQLVTIDPRAQTKTPHTTPGSTTSANNQTVQNDNASTAAPVMAQTTDSPSQDQLSDTESNSNNLFILLAILIGGVSAAYIYRVKNQTNTGKNADDS